MIEAMLADVYSPEMPEVMKAKLRAALEAAPHNHAHVAAQCDPLCPWYAARVLLDWMRADDD